MNRKSHIEIGRRQLLKLAAAATLAGTCQPLIKLAAAQERIQFATWAAAVDQVKAHINAFENDTGIKVEYSNAPWAQYREAMITKLAANAPLDVMWVSDTWLPEWVEADWLAPLDDFPELMKYNAEAEQFATESMIYNGRQYGLTYYVGFMSFLYNEQMLAKAGIAAPPQTWEELTQQALKVKQAGVAEYPVMLALARETWLIEFLSAMVFSTGGRFADDSGEPLMHHAQGGALEALTWTVDAIHTHEIVSPGAVDTGELTGLKAFASGAHAFALLPKNRMRVLNDPAQSQVPGRIKIALMPKGFDGSHASVGWIRFYGMTKEAAADPQRAANAVKLIEWFGGKANGEYRFQKMMALDFFTSFAVKPLFDDPEIREFTSQFADVDLVAEQQALARKKDVITPWFGEWNDANGLLWQQALLKQLSPEEALGKSADVWTELKDEFG